MADESAFKTIQQFLDKANPKEEAVRVALGVSELEMHIFWAALNAVPDDTLAIPDLTKTAGKFANFPSPYIAKLKNKKLFEKGDGKGKYNIAPQAVKKMAAILAGEAPRADPKESGRRPKRRAARRKKGEAPAAESVKVPTKIAKKTVGEAVEKLQARLAELDAERTVITARIEGILALFQDE